jgi:multiple sugar transport system substrate-binding protein
MRAITLIAVCALASVALSQVVLSFVGPEAPSSMEPVIAAFEAQNPGIIVEYESVPFNDLNDIVQIRIGGGEGTPDIYTADQPRISALASRGLLADITDDVGDISAIFWPSSIDASTVDGRLYALPVSTSSQLLYYNVDLLQAAGLELPSMDPAERLTWETVVDMGRAAQAAGADYGVMLDQVNRIYQVQPLAESLGGGPGVAADNELMPAFTNDAWIQAMTFYGSLFEEGLAPRGVPVAQTRDLFVNGQVALWVGGPWWLPLFSGSDVEFGVAPHPYFASGEPVTPTGAWSWGMNPNTEHRAEALAFLMFATMSNEGALATAQGFPLPPANIQVFNDYYAQNQIVPGVEDLILYELANTARVRAKTRGYIQFEEVIGQAIEDIRNGADVASTLESAAEQLERTWSRLE